MPNSTLHTLTLDGRHWAVIVVIAVSLAALGFDMVVRSWEPNHPSFCQGARDINVLTRGLLALCSLGLWIHIFCVQWLPDAWTQFLP